MCHVPWICNKQLCNRFIYDAGWLTAILYTFIAHVRFNMLSLIIILNSVSLQSRVSILKACLRKSPISKVCVLLMLILNPGGWDSHIKQTGMLVVLLRVVNFGFWSRLGCSGQSANILCRQGLGQGSAKKHRITRRETEVKFFLKFSFQTKAFDDYVFISLKLLVCHICVFLSGLFQGSKFG